MIKNKMLLVLLAEYKKVAEDYKLLLKNISQSNFLKIRDSETNDSDCKSIQTITHHIINSGYTYANYINSLQNIDWFNYNMDISNLQIVSIEIDKMLDFTEQTFNNIAYKKNKEIASWIFKTRWHVTYDFEQLIEHAIVHILRHRRQVENFLLND
jgi:hypothetical protein